MSPQFEIAASVVLKGHSTSVIEIVIGFDDQALLGPKKIREIGADANIDLRRWESVPATELDEIALQIAARAVATAPLVHGQTDHIRLTNGSAQLARRHRPRSAGNGVVQIADGARRIGDGYASTKRHLPCEQRQRTMHPDPGAARSAAVPGDDHIDRTLLVREETPERRRASVAHGGAPILEYRPVPLASIPAYGENGCEQAALEGRRGMSHCVDPTMDPMQPSRIDASSHSALADSQVIELPDRNEPMLAAGDSRDRRVGPGDFRTHMGG